MDEQVEPSPELEAEARQHPGGWVYEMDGKFSPNDTVPPEAIKGAWEVDENGKLTGVYQSNPRYRPFPR